ncbi:hypothetical protein GC096_25980 [Paenibacillus sp. LMG 31461]|uniref:Uncharacterized protein n=1 Tax=Paenibacillus plantarum TaxID=2654975 RepID=A0ABX1XG66_9BACL|nr:hypothetical protein [Paenibacillus plantarum]NOU67497.1 hypothetical protein [Paenibacillus plantarum]
MFEIDQLKLDELEKFSMAHPKCELVLSEIAHRMYNTKAPKIPPLSAEIYSEEVTLAIQVKILVQTQECLSFKDSQHFAFFLAKALISSRFKSIWEQRDRFWVELVQLQLEYLEFDIMRHTEVMLVIIMSRQHGIELLESIVPILKTVTQREQWILLQVVAFVLPYLNLENKIIVNFLEDLHGAEISNFNNNNLAKALELLSNIRPKVGEELLETWTTTPTLKSFWLIVSVAIGLAKNIGTRNVHTKAIDLIESQNESLINAGITICGLLYYDDTTDVDLLNKTFEKLDLLLQNEYRIPLRQVLAQAYGSLVTISEQAKFAVLTMSAEPVPEIQSQIASILLMHSNNYLDEEWFHESLFLQTKVSVEHKEIINSLDYTLYYLVSNHVELVEKFLERWVEEHDAPQEKQSIADLFDMLIQSFLNKQKPRFEKLLTSWFIRDDVRFHLHIQEMIQNLAINNITFCLDQDTVSQWSSIDTKYVIMKIMGFVSDNKNLCQLTFSILRREPEEQLVNMLVRNAFKEYVGYNYPGVTRELLSEKLGNGTCTEKKVAREILVDLDCYQQALRGLPKIKEFYPPEGRANKYEKMKSKQLNRQIEKNTEENSIFLQIVNRVVLKGGRSSFSRIQGKLTEKTELSRMSLEMEFPRGENIDPIGQAIKRFNWRQCRKEDIK